MVYQRAELIPPSCVLVENQTKILVMEMVDLLMCASTKTTDMFWYKILKIIFS